MNKLADIPIGDFKPPITTGPLADPATNTASTFESIISLIIGVITSVAFIYYLFRFFMAAISLITSGGDKKDKNKLAEARSALTNATIGLVLVIAAIFLVQFVGWLLGVENILNPTAIL